MTILAESLNKIRDYLSTTVDEGDWGTGTAVALPTNTGLAAEIASIEVTTTNTTADKTVQFTAVLPSTSGGTAVIAEHVTRYSDGTEHTRVTFSGITKSSTKEIHCISTTVVQQSSI